MAITGRTALVAALGALLAPLGTGGCGRSGVCCWSVSLVDLALAGRVADLRLSRTGRDQHAAAASRSRSRCW